MPRADKVTRALVAHASSILWDLGFGGMWSEGLREHHIDKIADALVESGRGKAISRKVVVALAELAQRPGNRRVDSHLQQQKQPRNNLVFGHVVDETGLGDAGEGEGEEMKEGYTMMNHCVVVDVVLGILVPGSGFRV